MKLRTILAITLAVSCAAIAHAQAPMPYGPSITADVAKKLAAPAVAEAKKNNWTMAVAIVDPAGDLVYFEKMDDTQVGSTQIAIDKARSAARFKRATKTFQDGLAAGGAGLRGPQEFAVLAQVAAALSASVGGTRVVADADWLPFERQIGTTGVAVDPDLYLAFGISGAVQHVNGLGAPDAVVSVNTDPSCPMMAMADLALVTDAGPLLAELATRLCVSDSTPEAEERRSA